MNESPRAERPPRSHHRRCQRRLVAEHVANGTLQAALVGEVNGEENAELAFLSADAMPSYTAGRLRLFEQRVCDGTLR